MAEDEATQRKNGKKLRDLKIDRVGQLCLQADEQGGCLTNVELALLLRTTPTTITKYIREYENKHDTILPRRGTIHDLGPTLTHKKEICRLLFLEGCSVIETCRRTKHSVQAVNRYITNFKQVLTCKTNGLSVEATAFATKLSQPLVKEYHRLFDEYAVTDQRIAKLIQSKQSSPKIRLPRSGMWPDRTYGLISTWMISAFLFSATMFVVGEFFNHGPLAVMGFFTFGGTVLLIFNTPAQFNQHLVHP